MSDENNFKPTLEGYKPLRPFELFMKNNFPFIENTFEALDTYGLLCEIVKYLNVVIDNTNTTEENVQLLSNAFNQLNDYVSNYFDNLDVQEEINNKLDGLVEDGTMSALILPYINEYEQTVNAQMLTQNNRITALESRMDTFTHLTEGSTSGDAELADARDAYDGFQYANVGNHIRSQIQYLNKENLLLNDNKDYFYDLSDYFEQGNVTISNTGWVYSTGTGTDDKQRIRVKENATLSVKAGDRLVVTSDARVYIGMRTGTSPDYTYTSNSWVSNATYEFRYDCDVCLLISLNPQATLPSIKNVFYYVHLIRKNGVNHSVINLNQQTENLVNGVYVFDSKDFINGSGFNSSAVPSFNNKSRALMLDWYTAPFDMYFNPIGSGYRYAFTFDNGDNTYTATRWLTESYVVPEGSTFKLQIGNNPENTSATVDLDEAVNSLKIRANFVADIIGLINSENADKKYFNVYGNVMYGYINSSGVMTNAGQKKRISIESYLKFPYDIKFYTNPLYYCYVAMYNDDGTLKTYVSSLLENSSKAQGYIVIPKNTYFRFTIGLVGDTSATELSYSDIDKVWFVPVPRENQLEIKNIRDSYIPPIFLPSNPTKTNILHRGNETVYTENSIPAFESGAQIAFGIETDVRETSDGVLICMHDTSVNRTTDAETIIGEGDNYVQNLTYSQIESLTINNIPEGYDASVPTFEEYLQICKKNGCIAVVEIKTDQLGSNNSREYENYISKIITMIKKYNMEQSCVIMNFRSFFGDVVRQFSKIIHVVYLKNAGTDAGNNTIDDTFIDTMVANSSVAPSITTLGLNKTVIQYAHSKNHLVIPYGISSTDSADYNTWVANDCDGFIVSAIE